MRNWPTYYVDSQAAGSPIRNKFEIALPPGGKAGRFGTLGGAGLGVSRFSAHPREAVELIRYLSRSDVQTKRALVLYVPPTLPELYDVPEVRGPNPGFSLLRQAFRTGTVSRPSDVTGAKYPAVSAAYSQAVHSVLAGEKPASEAAAALENELVRITGFKKGPPSRVSSDP
jgi:trehalose/maltose transport system substrate-binding protein